MNALTDTERELVDLVENHLEEAFADPAKLSAWRLMPRYLQRLEIANVVAKLLRQSIARLGVAIDVETADFLTEQPTSATDWHAASVAEAQLRGSASGRAAAERKIAFITRLVAIRADEAERVFDLMDDPSYDEVN